MAKIVYISGRMSGLPDMGKKHFREAESRLLDAGYTVLNPASLPYGMDKAKYMPICLAMLDAADAVFMLSDWQDSPGARIEEAYAEYQGKEILMEGGIIL